MLHAPFKNLFSGALTQKTGWRSLNILTLVAMLFAGPACSSAEVAASPPAKVELAVKKLALITNEKGDKLGKITVALTATPPVVRGEYQPVVVSVESSNPKEGATETANKKLEFTFENWSVPQTVVIKGVDDNVADGTQPYNIRLVATSANPDPVTVEIPFVNEDDDISRIDVTAAPGLKTTEIGGTATFTVKLASEPTADVTIPVSSNITTEGITSTELLTFTKLNWNVIQTVTVTGVDDKVADGDTAYKVTFGAAASTDTKYNGLKPTDIDLVNVDNDKAGITVIGATALTTTERGDKANFDVKLDSEPTGDVTVTFTSSNEAEAKVTSTLIFTAVNFDKPQTVTVTGVADEKIDGDQKVTITGKATSKDKLYTRSLTDIVVTNLDSASAAIVVTQPPGVARETTEAGGTYTFKVALNSKPTATVIIDLLSDNLNEGTVSPAVGLLFTPTNYATQQTVTVKGVADKVVDGNRKFTISGVANSGDPAYASRLMPSVDVTNIDSNKPGISVTPTSGLRTTENGGTAEFSVVLTDAPASDVTIPIASDKPSEGTIAVSSLTFTLTDWNIPQRVTITGVRDTVADGDQPYKIVLAAATGPGGYMGLNPPDVLVINEDSKAAGITVTAAPNLRTTELGGVVTFTVVLDNSPTAEVTLPVATSNVKEGLVSIGGAVPAPSVSLKFNAINWNIPQTVTVVGVDDLLTDGDQKYVIQLLPTTSADPKYNGVDLKDIDVTNDDNETPNIIITTTLLETSESGSSLKFTVELNTQPTADVIVTVASLTVTEGIVDVPSLTFTKLNWNERQTVTVTGVKDDKIDGDQVYVVKLGPSTSADGAFNGLTRSLSLTNRDIDTPGFTINKAGNPLVTSEAGDKATFTVTLASKPASAVTVGLTSSKPSEGSVAPASLTFTAANWNLPQTVTITGVDDVAEPTVDGTQPYTINFATVTGDALYVAAARPVINMVNTDNDVPGIVVSKTAIVTKELLTTTDTFTVRLLAKPLGTVKVTVKSDAELTEASIVGGPTLSLTFSPSTWNVAQVVTVKAIDDFAIDGDQAYNITVALDLPGTLDDTYKAAGAGLNQTVTGTNVDAIPGIDIVFVTPTFSCPGDGTCTASVKLGGKSTFRVALKSNPGASVSVKTTLTNVPSGTVSPILTFTSANWSTPQLVTFTATTTSIGMCYDPTSFNFTATAATGPYVGLAPVTPINTLTVCP